MCRTCSSMHNCFAVDYTKCQPFWSRSFLYFAPRLCCISFCCKNKIGNKRRQQSQNEIEHWGCLAIVFLFGFCGLNFVFLSLLPLLHLNMYIFTHHRYSFRFSRFMILPLTRTTVDKRTCVPISSLDFQHLRSSNRSSNHFVVACVALFVICFSLSIRFGLRSMSRRSQVICRLTEVHWTCNLHRVLRLLLFPVSLTRSEAGILFCLAFILLQQQKCLCYV